MPEDSSSFGPGHESDPPKRFTSADPDDVLVAACLRGEIAAWDALIDRYQGFIFSVALRRGLSRSDAEDVFQNVCIKLYEHLGDLREVQRLSGWLASVTTREAAHLFRKETPRLFSETPSVVDDTAPGASVHALPSVNPEDEIIDLERRHIIRRMLGELSDECRQLLDMLYAKDPPTSYNDVAATLNIPLGSIGPKRARCLARLRSLLDRSGY